LQRDHRAATHSIVESGKPIIVGAFARIDATWRLDQIAHHAWRSAVHPSVLVPMTVWTDSLNQREPKAEGPRKISDVTPA
jgi:hypothetical protein